MQKHVYTEAEAPDNTGSMTRPARLNLRLTCQARGRTHDLLIRIRQHFNMPPDTPYAEVWESRALPALEHLFRSLTWGSAAERALAATLFAPTVPKDDYLVERGRRLVAGKVITQATFDFMKNIPGGKGHE